MADDTPADEHVLQTSLELRNSLQFYGILKNPVASFYMHLTLGSTSC